MRGRKSINTRKMYNLHMSERSTFEDANRPYFASKSHLEKLQEEVRVLDPERENEYQELQLKACGAFLEHFGSYLSDQQRQYMRARNVIVTDSEHLRFLEQTWASDAEIGVNKTLHGKTYFEYEIVDPDASTDDTSSEMAEVDGAQQFFSGRVTIVPLLKDYMATRARPDLLLSEMKKAKKRSAAEILSSLDEKLSIPADERTVARVWSGMALHEKIHAIHPPDHPLPIMEIGTHYYERYTYLKSVWRYRNQQAFDKAIKYWDELVQEFGPDLHLYFFGNITAEKGKILEENLFALFTETKMKELFEDPDSAVHVKWIEEK